MQLPDGSIIFEQKEVLNHIGKFYSKLFENKDSNLDFEKLNKILKNLNIPGTGELFRFGRTSHSRGIRCCP